MRAVARWGRKKRPAVEASGAVCGKLAAGTLVAAEEAPADIRPVLVDRAFARGEEFAAVLDGQRAVPRERELEPDGTEIPESLVFVPGKVDARK